MTLEKIEWNITDINYPNLNNMSRNEEFQREILEQYNFIKTFECKITEKLFYEQRGTEKFLKNALSTAIGIFGMRNVFATGIAAYYALHKNVDEQLRNLGARRSELKRELKKFNDLIEEKQKEFEEKKAKIARLENALINPYITQA